MSSISSTSVAYTSGVSGAEQGAAPPAPSPTAGSGGSTGLIIAAGLVSGVVVVLGTIAISILLLLYHRRQLRAARRAAAETARREFADLPDGDPSTVKIPIIVVLPDNKLRFAWEVPAEGEGGGGLERYPSDSLKSSIGDEASVAGGSVLDGDAAERGEAAPRCKPPLVSATIQIHHVDDNY